MALLLGCFFFFCDLSTLGSSKVGVGRYRCCMGYSKVVIGESWSYRLQVWGRFVLYLYLTGCLTVLEYGWPWGGRYDFSLALSSYSG